MGEIARLFFIAVLTAAVFCAPLYFALPRSHLQLTDKKWLFGKLVAVFVATEVILQLLFKTETVQASDGWTNIIGPMVAAYLAGKFLFTRQTPTV